MKEFILGLFIVLQGSQLFAQQEKKNIHKGNELYHAQKYKEAEENYRKSIELKSGSIEGNFNLGDALYKQQNYADAAQQFVDIASSSKDKMVQAKAYHNLGNSLFQSKKLEESIAAYKKSLLANPKDDETRYNLAYAKQMLKQQQKKDDNKKNENNKDQNSKDQDKKDENQKKDQEQKDQGSNQDQQNREKEQDQKQQTPTDQLSKEDAERMLDALTNKEEETLDKLKNKKLEGVEKHIEKDW